MELNDFLKSINSKKLFVLNDTNTLLYCSPFLDLNLQENTLTLEPGENTKSLASCEEIWDYLQINGADRSSILLNIGGGVITDLGGFAASLYQRGISFIHIPTSLLAMVDAAIGGKTGVDFKHLKNYIGNFSGAEHILICPTFLNTLPHNEWLNGWAEAIKHALIAKADLLPILIKQIKSNPNSISLPLLQSICEIKNEIVQKDPFEKNIRKSLNFGHTIGHALESYFLKTNQPIPHGLAVVAGMLMESFISKEQNKDFKAFESIREALQLFPRISFNFSDCRKIALLTLKDKKNTDSTINLTLLTAIGQYKINCSVDLNCIQQSLESYCNNEY